MLGVNADEQTDVPEIVQRHNINWRSWLDGNNGPIVQSWQTQFFPTVYLIDHEGVIRHKNLNGEQLDAAIDTLIEKVEAPG